LFYGAIVFFVLFYVTHVCVVLCCCYFSFI